MTKVYCTEKVMESVDRNFEKLIEIKVEMCGQIQPIEEEALFSQGESSNLAPVCASVLPESCQPNGISNSGSVKGSNASDLFGTIIVTDSSKSGIRIDSQWQPEYVGFDVNNASDTEFPDGVCFFSRNKCKSNYSRRTRSEKASKRCKKAAKQVLCPDRAIGLLFRMVRRKRRSCLSKPARSSMWGLLSDISKSFEQSSVPAVNQEEIKKSREGKAGRDSPNYAKNFKLKSSQGLKGKHHAPTGRIRLKVKLGREVVRVDQTGDNALNREVVTAKALAYEVTGDSKHELHAGSSLASFKSGNAAEDKVEIPEIRQFHFSSRNAKVVETYHYEFGTHLHTEDKGREMGTCLDTSAGNCFIGKSLPLEAEVLKGANDSGFSDPGTSPDSEVINSIPDAQVDADVQEGTYGANLISSRDNVSLRDVAGLNLPQKSTKKGMEKSKVPKEEARLLKEQRSKQKGTRAYNCETLASSASGNILGGMSSRHGLSMEPLDSSKYAEGGVSTVAWSAGCGLEASACPSPDLGTVLSESQSLKKSLPLTKSMIDKVSKSKKNGVSKDREVVVDLVRNWSEKGSRKKEIRLKSLTAKGEEKDRHIVCEMGSLPKTGQALPGYRKFSTVDMKFFEDKSSRNAVRNWEVEPCLPPRSAWVRCDDCHKWRRIPATLADSIAETDCKWTCKENMDKIFSDCSVPQEKSNADINAELEISDASCEEDVNNERLNPIGMVHSHPTIPQQSTWTLIKSNLFLHRRRKTQSIDEIMVCHCKRPQDGSFGCGDECLNRMLNIECVKGTCPCGDLCSNQQFQKRKYAKLKSVRCGKKGYGLQSVKDISKGQFLIEYVGEVLDLHTYEARQREYAAKGHKHFYFMTLNGSEVIDACGKGNLGRFVNHSCEPNCRTEKWMVNGEICIGLFALRDIKKDEEVTFDYNYVRVFGAAAKKCVCGSSQCRGYIGGDPLNTDTIVQGDSDEEYPGPSMVLRQSETCDSLDNAVFTTSSVDIEEVQPEEALTTRDTVEVSASVQREDTLENGSSDERFASSLSQVQSSPESADLSGNLPSSAPVETFLQTENMTSKSPSSVEQENNFEEDPLNKSVHSPKSLDNSCSTATSDGNNVKSGATEDHEVLLRSHLLKTSHSPSLVRKGKHKNKPPIMANKTQLLPGKPKKWTETSVNCRFEAVQEKLNDLLDADGGISKRRDATKGYLKLLLLTAASGNSGTGEAIQSNRDLSMILDALLKTKSRMVLNDIINKNGLRMLHNIMKQYRRDFKKIPILRKLLKVLEYLAAREILTLEHINGGPPCPGMESFMESILTLTEHSDKQVHQIARNFRDRWIPRSLRKISCIDTIDSKTAQNCNPVTVSDCRLNQNGTIQTEATESAKQSMLARMEVDAGSQQSSSAPPCSGTRVRKRKSRWDQPSETEPAIKSSPPQTGLAPPQPEICAKVEESRQSMLEDGPPGFSPPISAPLVPPNTSSDLSGTREIVVGLPCDNFVPQSPVSYGIPLSVLENLAVPRAESLDSWIIAPSIPFHPFPPLPRNPRAKRDAASFHGVPHGPDTRKENRVRSASDGCASGYAHDPHAYKRPRVGFHDPERRHFKQQKWNNWKFGPPPWVRIRNNWGFEGNNGRSRTCMGSAANEVRNTYSSEGTIRRLGETHDASYQHR